MQKNIPEILEKIMCFENKKLEEKMEKFSKKNVYLEEFNTIIF
jgi:hypothetical protein